MRVTQSAWWFAILWAVATAGLGMALSASGGAEAAAAWYLQLRKPWWQPPAWVFGPAWSVIFALAAWAYVRARRAGAGGGLVVAYVVNGVLNAGWTGLFFGLHRIDLALFEVVPLWLSVLAMLLLARRHDARAAWLLAPYLAWVGFAGFLTYELWRLNGSLG